jgi:uncharacterized protein (DUF2236 family)
MKLRVDPIRIVRWLSGAKLPDVMPIHDTAPDPGLMGPGTVTWRLHREQWLILGGAQAFLMQAAHPKVAQGALDHSAYAEDPFGRVFRTVMSMTVFLSGTRREAEATARRINHIHANVQGTLPEAVGRFAAGEPYSALETGPLLWVHVAFVESMLNAYRHFVGALSYDACDRYWRESMRYARLLELRDADLPPTYAAMRRYIRQAIASGEVAVGDGARTIARTVLYPPLPWHRRAAWGLVRVLASGLLPPEIRAGYGLRWGPPQRIVFWSLTGLLRAMRFLLPNLLGRSQVMDFAQRRTRGALADGAQVAPASFSAR